MTVEQVHLVDGAASWDVRAGVGEAVVGRAHGVPGSQVTPEAGNVNIVANDLCRAMRLGKDQGEGLCGSIVVGVSRSSLSRSRLDTSHCYAGKANTGLARELLRVDDSCMGC